MLNQTLYNGDLLQKVTEIFLYSTTFTNLCLIGFCFQSLDGHHGAITCVTFDEYHIITGSLDCYAMAWSSIGKHKKCLQAFRHPKYVNSYWFFFLHVPFDSS